MQRLIQTISFTALLMLVFASPAMAASEAELLAVLKNPDATRKQKHDACRELSRVATPKAVPVLAELLVDPEMSHMARYALEPIPDASVDAALRAALGKAEGKPLAGVIGSIGVRGDATAVPALAKFLPNKDADIAGVAARALGNIGTADAARALQAELGDASPAQLKQLCEGLLRCAESLAAEGQKDPARAIYDRLNELTQSPHQIRTAALRGAVLVRGDQGVSLLQTALRDQDYLRFASAVRVSMELDGAPVTAALADTLSGASADRQILVIQAMGQRGDASGAAALMKTLASKETSVAVESAKALTRIHHAPALPELVKLALGSNSELVKIARECLVGFPGDAADQAVMNLLKSDQTKTRQLGAELVGLRRIGSSTTKMLEIARSDSDPATRIAALNVLRNVAQADAIEPLLDILITAKSSDVIAATEQALLSTCSRQSDPQKYAGQFVEALAKASGSTKPTVIGLLRSVGGAEALMAVRAAAEQNDAEIRLAAQKTLCNWPTPDVLPTVMAMAKNPPSNVLKVLALRGCYRLIPLQNIADDKKIEQVKQVMAVSERTEEKRLALAALQNIGSAQTLPIILAQLDDKAMQTEAALAVMQVARTLMKSQPQAVVGALQRVNAVVTDKRLNRQIHQLTVQAEAAMYKKMGYAPAGDWKPLFNGKDIKDWKQTGQGIYTVEDGNLVGTQTDGKGGDLAAPGTFDNFDLRITYRVKWPANSGIWFRWDGRKGYQFDILKHPRPVAYSGTLYCPGKMFIIQNLDESLENRDGWNQARICAAGPYLTQWINGVMTGSVKDDTLKSGQIGFQVHGGNQFKGMKIILKRLDIRPLKKQ